jgi:hypothetical protein
VFLAAAALGLLVAILLFFSRRDAAAAPAPQPSPRAAPMVVAAIDGLGLDGPQRPAAVLELLSRGATGWWQAEREPRRRSGRRSPRGLVAPPRRPRPGPGPAARRRARGSGAVGDGVVAAAHRAGDRAGGPRPVSSADRQALAFWEVAASAGLRSLSVGWWAAGDWPGAVVVDNRAVLGAASGGEEADRAALDAFDRRRVDGFALATVYLPGCDIERDSPERRARAAATISAWLARLVDRASRGEIVLVVIASDSHPAPPALGRLVVFDGPPRPRTVRIRAVDVAPSILARLGVPRAKDLEGAPVAALFEPGTVEETAVPSYGARVAPEARRARVDREYLEKLRSLGYLK